MKKSFLTAAGTALASIAVSVFVYVNNGKNETDEFFNANVEALARSEGTPVRECYTRANGASDAHIVFCNDRTLWPRYIHAKMKHGGQKVFRLCA